MAERIPRKDEGAGSSPVVRAIINTSDQLKAAGGGVALTTATITTSRAAYVPATHWVVMRVQNGQHVETDPAEHWQFHGSKAFSFGRDKWVALTEAKAWLAKMYDEPGPWMRNKMGDYVPTRINKAFPICREK